MSFLGSVGNVLGIGNAGGGYSNPADAGMPYLDQIAPTITPYYQPYIDNGQNAMNTLMPQYNQLISNPGQKFAEMGQGFQQSPGYQFQYNQGMNAANSAAQAGGMAGTPYHQQNAANMASNLANQDFYNYMNQVSGLYDQGMAGMSDVNHMGYNASDQLAQSLMSALMSQSGMAYAGANNQNAANQASNSNMMNLIGGAIGSFF